MSTENKTLEAEALAWMESDEFKTCPSIFLVKVAYIAGAKRGMEIGFEMARQEQPTPVETPEGEYWYQRYLYATYEDALKSWEGKK